MEILDLDRLSMLLQVVTIDLVLAGDNAVVIALAAAGLPVVQRRKAIFVGIEMDDGITLRADVFRPDDAGKYAVILAYGPYGKGLSFQEYFPYPWKQMTTTFPETKEGSSNKFQNWEVVDPEKWVPDGYVCVRVDSRGSGRSPGVIDPHNPREAKDLHDCIEWAARQPWSNGKIGICGISYFAVNGGAKPGRWAAQK